MVPQTINKRYVARGTGCIGIGSDGGFDSPKS